MIHSVRSQKELENCGFVKTVLMLTVVLYHSCLFWGGNWFVETPVFASGGLALMAEYLNSFHIYGFTLVSGYLFSYLKREKGKYGRFLPFAANKAKRLLVPYAFVAAVWVIPISVLFSGFDGREIFTKFVLATAPSQLWFLVMLFVVFLMAWALFDLFEKRDMLGCIVAAGSYGVGIVGGMLLPNVFSVWTACKYLMFFWIGFKLRQKGTRSLSRIPAIVWVALHGLLFAGWKFVSALDGKLFTLLALALEFAAHIAGALMAFFVLQELAERLHWKNSRILAFLERNAMTTYLFHQQVIYFSLALLNGVVNPYFNALLNFVAAMAVSLVLGELLRKFPVTGFLVGESIRRTTGENHGSK